jgi:hypothetical protein
VQPSSVPSAHPSVVPSVQPSSVPSAHLCGALRAAQQRALGLSHIGCYFLSLCEYLTYAESFCFFCDNGVSFCGSNGYTFLLPFAYTGYTHFV